MKLDDHLTLERLWKDLRTVFARHGKLIALTTLSCVAVVYVGLLFVSDQFEAQTSLLVRLGRENVDVPVTVEHGSIFADGVKKEEVNSQIALLTSRPLLFSAIDSIGVDRFLGPGPRPAGLLADFKFTIKQVAHWAKDQLRDALVAVALTRRLSEREQVQLLVERNLNATQIKDSDVIDVRLRLSDPELARQFLEELTKKYLDRHAEIREQGGSVTAMFETQAKAYSDRLSDLRGQSAKMKSDLGVFSVAEQRSQLFDMLKAAAMAKQESELELAKTTVEESNLNVRLPQLEPTIVQTAVVSPSTAQTQAKEMLGELRVERAQALAKYVATADPVKKLDDQIAQLDALTNSVESEDGGPKTLARNPIVSRMDFQREDDKIKIAVLEAGIKAGQDQILSIQSELQRLDGAETELARLDLEINVAQNRFTESASKREESRMTGIMDSMRLANVTVLSEPSVSEKPVAPKRLLMVGLGLVLGFAMGVGLGLTLEWQRDDYDAKDSERSSPDAQNGTETQNGRLSAAGKRIEAH